GKCLGAPANYKFSILNAYNPAATALGIRIQTEPLALKRMLTTELGIISLLNRDLPRYCTLMKGVAAFSGAVAAVVAFALATMQNARAAPFFVNTNLQLRLV